LLFVTTWAVAKITSLKWPNKKVVSSMRRNIVCKVVRKYFCRDASNPSEPAGRNTSDSELEKRVRLRDERERIPLLWKN